MIMKLVITTRNSNVNYCYFSKCSVIQFTTYDYSNLSCHYMFAVSANQYPNVKEQSESYEISEKIRMIVYLSLYSKNSAVKLNYFPSFLGLLSS